MRKGTYVLESLTSSMASSKECRGGVAVDVVEDVFDFHGYISVFGLCLNSRDLADVPWRIFERLS